MEFPAIVPCMRHSRPVVALAASVLVSVAGACGSSGTKTEIPDASSLPDASEESCTGGCEGSHPWTDIYLASGSSGMAAIETLANSGTSSECGTVYWRGTVARPQETVCPAQPIDASGSSAACARHYPCEPSYLDTGGVCSQATIQMSVPECRVTVVSITGERQSYDVALSQSAPYRCHTADGTCVTAAPSYTSPATIMVAFAPADAGPATIDGPGAID